MPDLHHDDAQWGDLAVLLREDRPEPDPVFAHRMDKLADRGFQGWTPPLRMEKKPWWRPLMSGPALGTALAAMLVALVIALPNNPDEGGSGGRSGGSAGGGGSSAETASAPNANDS